MNELPSATVILSAIAAGMILGLSIGTDKESRLRGTRTPLTSIWRPRSPLGAVMRGLLWLLGVTVVMTVVVVITLRVGGAYPLSKVDRYTFLVFWFCSTACSRHLRYCYWKKKSRTIV